MNSNELNKAGLMHLIARAERGALLPGEAQILRDAVEALDDLRNALEAIGGDCMSPGRDEMWGVMRAIDEEAPGCP